MLCVCMKIFAHRFSSSMVCMMSFGVVCIGGEHFGYHEGNVKEKAVVEERII